MIFSKFKFKNYFPIFLGIFFILLFSFYIPFLFPYGDATIHAMHTNTLIQKGWQFVVADYPYLYYYITAYLQLFFGDIGYSLSVMIGIFLIFSYLFLICRLFTVNSSLLILTLILVGQSSKIINYSFRLYQEIFITGIFLGAFFYFLKYFYCQITKKSFNFLILYIAIAASLKQQGLLILWPSYVIFCSILFLFNKLSFKKLFLIILVPIIISAPFYSILFHNRGILILGNLDFISVRLINYFGQKIFRYEGEDGYIATLDDVFTIPEKSQYVNTAAISFQERHTTFARAFSSRARFNDIHLIYARIGSQNNYLALQSILLIILFFGIFLQIKNYNKSYPLLLYSVIFLGINYYLFKRNSDQARYHVFIPFILYIFSLKSFIYIVNNNKYLFLFLSFFLIISTSGLTYSQITKSLKSANQSQIYSGSIGGIHSLIEAGIWIKNNIHPESYILHNCGNEISYYSNMHNVFNLDSGLINFYEKNRLEAYILEKDINYVIILKSQIINDRLWNNFCKVPEFYFNNVEALYKKIYISSKQDVFIYEVKKIPYIAH